MGGWGNEENFSDYTVLYDLGFPDWSHGIPKTPSKMLQTMFNFRSPYKIISYYTVELIASELINEFQKNLWLKCSVWSDLAKIRHFGKSQVFCNSLTVYFLFGKMLSILCQICDIIGLIFIVSNGQILKNNLTILSHWCQDNHLIIAFPSCSLFDGFDLTKEINLFYVQHKQSSWK